MAGITTCIFDLDGVIVDTAKFHFLAWQRLAKELNIPFTERDNERLKGVSRMESLDILLSLDNRNADQKTKNGLAARKNGWFVEYINALKPQEIFPGVRDLLQQARTPLR
jgi:beta-phosphoglucomutase